MPPKTSPLPLDTVLTLLRSVQGWQQNELAAALGCVPTLVCDYEAGRKPLSRKRLNEIVAVMGMPPEAVDHTLSYLVELRALSPPEGGSAGAGEAVEAVVAQMTVHAEAFARSMLRLDDHRRAQQARHDARFLWERLKPLSPAQRCQQVQASPELRTWALCELVCEKSLEAAADRADRALDLANLAVLIAETAPGHGDWRKRLQGYALAHLANARRVGSDLPGAEKTFAKARKLWEAGALAEPGFLQEALMLGLEASLRKGQRRLDEALNLLEQALKVDDGSLRRQLLVARANVLELAREFEGAIATLKEVELLVSENDEPRTLCLIWFNLANNFLQTGRVGEAQALLPKLTKLVSQLGNNLDMLRLQWLEGRTYDRLHQGSKAISILARVREDFTAKKIAYDAALVTLELAALLLEEGRTGEVRNLSRQVAWIFTAQGVHREALASLRLFCEAVEQEALTVEMARRFIDYFHRARHDPDLRFAP